MRTTLAVLLPWWNASRPGAARLAAAPRRRAARATPARGGHIPRRVPVRKLNTVDIWIPSVSNVGMTVRLRRAEQVERNRSVVLDAARRVFLDRGYGGATVDAIAEEAGLLQGGRLLAVRQQGGHVHGAAGTADHRARRRRTSVSQPGSPWPRPRGSCSWQRTGTWSASRDGRSCWWSSARTPPAIPCSTAGTRTRTGARLRSSPRSWPGSMTRPGRRRPCRCQSMAEFVLAMGTGVTLERAANPAALPADHGVPMMLRALDGVTQSGEQPADQLIQPASTGPAGPPDPRGVR